MGGGLSPVSQNKGTSYEIYVYVVLFIYRLIVDGRGYDVVYHESPSGPTAHCHPTFRNADSLPVKFSSFLRTPVSPSR